MRTKVMAVSGVGSISLLDGMPMVFTRSSKGLNSLMFSRRTGASGSLRSDRINLLPQILCRIATSCSLSFMSIQPVMNIALAENKDMRMALSISS